MQFDGSKLKEPQGWMQTINASLLNTPKKDGAHDMSTSGPYIIKFLRGEPAAVFEEDENEAKSAIQHVHRLVWAAPLKKYPLKQPLE